MSARMVVIESVSFSLPKNTLRPATRAWSSAGSARCASSADLDECVGARRRLLDDRARVHIAQWPQSHGDIAVESRAAQERITFDVLRQGCGVFGPHVVGLHQATHLADDGTQVQVHLREQHQVLGIGAGAPHRIDCTRVGVDQVSRGDSSLVGQLIESHQHLFLVDDVAHAG